ncbi:MAG: hypothetical protein ACRC8A_07995 [Microcoleaceae cyanobacterium]
MAYWVKITDDQKQYFVNLEQVGAFCTEFNKRIKFWLPDIGQPIIVNNQSNPEEYQKLWHYLALITDQTSPTYWLKIHYERRDYIINLDRVYAFSYDQGKRITFWLPDGVEPIILNSQSYAEAYQKVQDYVERTTGYTLS